MASSQRQAFRVMFVLSTLLFHFFFISTSSSLAIRDSKLEEEEEEKGKVNLTVYYEALCPFCSYFIAQHLTRVVTDGLLPIVRLRLVPWGNAGLDVTGSIQCQHGPTECLLNAVEACTISVYPETEKHFFLIQCIESLTYQKREAEWQSCFAKASLNPQPIFDCYNRGTGHQLELQYAYETTHLNPPHAYVPWVLVNDQPLRENYQNFVNYVCKAYKGNSIPPICQSARLGTSLIEEEEEEGTGNSYSTSQVCYPDNSSRQSPEKSSEDIP